MDEMSRLEDRVENLISSIKARCDAADIKYLEESSLVYSERIKDISVLIPDGRGTRTVPLYDENDLKDFAEIPFEEIKFLDGYEAICRYKQNSVEAAIRPASFAVNRATLSSFGRLFEKKDDGTLIPVRVSSGSERDKVVATLGPASPELKVLTGGEYSITVKHHSISRQDRTKELLIKIADTLMFQTDLLAGVAFYLTRRRTPRQSAPPKRPKLQAVLAFPSCEYESGPMSLYWYGRSADGVPLLQFLAFYQVIEYFYPTYSEVDARKKLQIILKDPLFRSDRDTDIVRLIKAIQINRDGAIGNERSQIKATIKECVDAGQLVEFVNSNSERAKVLTVKLKGLSDAKLSIASPDADILAEAAERIYDIRCRIVHTKTDARDEGNSLLLPFSKEAETLQFDIQLVQFMAQRVLIASSSPIRIE